MEKEKMLHEKFEKLKNYIADLGSLAVGFSGGVDSSFLLAVAREVLGEKAIAVTAGNEAIPEREMKEAEEFCKERGIRQIICKVEALEIREFRENRRDRCYFCKKKIFSDIKKAAAENGIEYVAEGSNMDDLGDYRPGHRAIAELEILSPLRVAELYKDEIRQLSREMGLPTWSKPSYACLASRFVYDEEITGEKLHMVDMAEQFLIENGFLQERVRMHGNMARIEVPPEDIARLAEEEIRTAVYNRFKEIGFMFVTLDLKGYSTGSMNATISDTVSK